MSEYQQYENADTYDADNDEDLDDGVDSDITYTYDTRSLDTRE